MPLTDITNAVPSTINPIHKSYAIKSSQYLHIKPSHTPESLAATLRAYEHKYLYVTTPYEQEFILDMRFVLMGFIFTYDTNGKRIENDITLPNVMKTMLRTQTSQTKPETIG